MQVNKEPAIRINQDDFAKLRTIVNYEHLTGKKFDDVYVIPIGNQKGYFALVFRCGPLHYLLKINEFFLDQGNPPKPIMKFAMIKKHGPELQSFITPDLFN